MTAGLIVFALAQLADILTTVAALRRGGREANPVILWAMRTFGSFGWIVFKLMGAASVAWVAVEFSVPLLLWVAAAITGIVAVRNTQVMR